MKITFIILLFGFSILQVQSKSVAKMKECLTYVLGYNQQCYQQYQDCLLKDICQGLYVSAKLLCLEDFKYDTDQYLGECINTQYEKLQNDDARLLVDCLQEQCDILNNQAQLLPYFQILLMIYLFTI
ncbi:unnamed protein product [Paramecium sonneborni]|uniref:Transmembrane protein n=1 Tax=Paramecium sonneborni TaxID=65129 RepID=A0A8S1L449_9CILI|nr:unnamed protein product [Paramecium sonneborni]